MKTVKACLTLVLAAHLLVCAVFCVSGTVAQGADGQGGESYLFSGHIKVRNTEYFFKISNLSLFLTKFVPMLSQKNTCFSARRSA